MGSRKTDANAYAVYAGAERIRPMWDPNFADPWASFVQKAREYKDTGKLEDEEITYKLEIGRKLASVRQSVLSDADDWAKLLEIALRPRQGHPMNWRNVSKLNQWSLEDADNALAALQEIWSSNSKSALERVRGFCSSFPTTIISGKGTRANIASVLLMGVDVKRYPPFETTLFKKAYELTRYIKPDQGADEGHLYDYSLGFLDYFIKQAEARGVSLRHRLDAQSIVWAIIKGRIDIENGEEGEEEGEELEGVAKFDLAELAAQLFLPVDFLQEITQLLSEKKQVIFQGPPGTGKTYLAQALAKHLAGADEAVTRIQFHPSYAYEDFVQGFRPNPQGKGEFTLRDGPLLQAARAAQQDLDEVIEAGQDADSANKHYLIIDEINRGNLGKVFGELYFLLEYRDEKIQLQYQEEGKDPFSLPKNLYIIGTMNTADRSIALVDLALRRRFYFMDFHPDEEPIKGVLRRWLEANAPGMLSVADMIDAANEMLKDDPHAAIGPSYFIRPGLDDKAVERIWKHSVLPYLTERLFENAERLADFDLRKLRAKVEVNNGAAGGNGRRPAEEEGEPEANGEQSGDA